MSSTSTLTMPIISNMYCGHIISPMMEIYAKIKHKIHGEIRQCREAGFQQPSHETSKENEMSVYKMIELVGTSSESWEKAAEAAVETASKSLRDLRVAEIVELDMQLEDGKVKAYRAKVKLSFKYQT